MKKYLLVLLSFLLISSITLAETFFDASDADGMWYDPEHPGHGVVLNYNSSSDSAALTWFLHRPDKSSAFLSGKQLCEFYPCTVELLEPSASLLGGHASGVGTFFEIGPTVGEATLTLKNDNQLRVDFNFIPWLGEYCEGISAGGYLWRGCAGTLNLERLTNPY
jgi:hypothetical protein